MTGQTSCWPTKISNVLGEKRRERVREGGREIEGITWDCSPVSGRGGGCWIFAGARMATEKKADAGSTGRRCSGSSPAMGKGKMDAVRRRGSCGGAGLFR
jgi:hypothetical protein